MDKKTFSTSKNGITITSFSKQLVMGFGEDLLSSIELSCESMGKDRKVVFLLGPHLGIPPEFQRSNMLKVCVQTKLLFDDYGNKLPRLKTNNLLLLYRLAKRIRQAMCKSDFFWDLNESNSNYYSSTPGLRLRSGDLLGPFIFPAYEKLPICPNSKGQTKKVIFFGSLSPRRLSALRAIESRESTTLKVESKLFGERLRARIQEFDAITNINA